MGEKLKVLDLFSGIGGFSLGLERTGGFDTAAFCEIDSYCQGELRRRWNGVPIYGDICQLSAQRLAADGVGPIDAICGGFPCQDLSVANTKGAGLDGAKSGLWSEYARLIGELRPRVVIVENVTALLCRGFGRVLGDLAGLGYDAEWEVISASDVGAPHDRERLWVVAYPSASGWEGVLRHWPWISAETRPEWPTAPLDTQRRAAAWLARAAESISPVLGDDDGLPARLAKQQLGAFGNAVVPQIPELIGRAILATIESQRAAA